MKTADLSSKKNINRLTQAFILTIAWLSMAFQCGHGKLIRLAADLDLSVQPNPVPVTDQQGQFQFSWAYPPGLKVCRSCEAVTFVFSAESGEQPLHEEVVPTELFQRKPTVRHRKDIAFEYELPADTVPLFLHMILHKNQQTKTGPRLQIGYLIKSD